MRKLKNFKDYENLIVESVSREIKSKFPGFAPLFSNAVKYTKDRGLDYEVINASEDGMDFPRLIIKGFEGHIDFPNSSGIYYPEEFEESLKKFAEQNGLNSAYSKTYYGSGVFPNLDSFLRLNIDKILSKQRSKEEFNLEKNRFYKMMLKSGIEHLENKNRPGLIFSHPFMIDGWKEDGTYGKGKVSISNQGPIRIMGPFSITSVIKSGKGFSNEQDLEFSLNQATEVIINKVLKFIGMSQKDINILKKSGIENVLSNFKNIISDNIDPEVLLRIVAGSTDEQMKQMEKIFGDSDKLNQMIQSAKIRRKVKNIMI